MKHINNFKKYLILIIMTFIISTNNVFAYGYDISVTSNSVTVGNSITLNIKGSGIAGRFNITSSNTNIATVSSGSVWIENNTQSITLNTKNTGTVNITITPGSITTTDENPQDVSLSAKTITINVNSKPVNNNPSGGNNSGNNKPVSKSTNSYLSSLTIDGLELNEKFDKQTLEYTVNVPANTEKIKINAQLEDSSAKVNGTGEVNVSDGLNTFEIVVTAENGSKRTYILKATVEELKPLEVKVGNDTFTVVRKRKDLPEISEYFTEKEIIINNESIEGYYNETLKYNVIGLKDKTGKINYYIYKQNKYLKYQEHTFNGITLQILDKEVPNTKKTNFIYNGDKIISYQEVKLDILKNTYALDNNDIDGNQFYLFYAINLETGKESLYQYDANEKTVQRYNTLVLDLYKERSNKYYIYLLSSILLLGLTIIIFSTILIHKNKSSKKEKNISSKKEEKLKESPVEDDFSFDDLPIKKKNSSPNKK